MNIVDLYLIKTVRDFHCFCRFELENMPIFEFLPALDLTQSVHDKICIGMHRGSNLKLFRIPLMRLVTRLGRRYRQTISSEA